MQFPEYLMATRTLKRERARRGVPDAVPLDIFAEVLKADLEQQRDALVPLYDPTGDRLLQDFDEATHRGDLARARTVYTQLEGTKELESAYAAAVRRILADSDDTRYRD